MVKFDGLDSTMTARVYIEQSKIQQKYKENIKEVIN